MPMQRSWKGVPWVVERSSRAHLLLAVDCANDYSTVSLVYNSPCGARLRSEAVPGAAGGCLDDIIWILGQDSGSRARPACQLQPFLHRCCSGGPTVPASAPLSPPLMASTFVTNRPLKAA